MNTVNTVNTEPVPHPAQPSQPCASLGNYSHRMRMRRFMPGFVHASHSLVGCRTEAGTDSICARPAQGGLGGVCACPRGPMEQSMADVQTGLAMGSAPGHGETRFLGPRSADRSSSPEPAPWPPGSGGPPRAHPPSVAPLLFFYFLEFGVCVSCLVPAGIVTTHANIMRRLPTLRIRISR